MLGSVYRQYAFGKPYIASHQAQGVKHSYLNDSKAQSLVTQYLPLLDQFRHKVAKQNSHNHGAAINKDSIATSHKMMPLNPWFLIIASGLKLGTILYGRAFTREIKNYLTITHSDPANNAQHIFKFVATIYSWKFNYTGEDNVKYLKQLLEFYQNPPCEHDKKRARIWNSSFENLFKLCDKWSKEFTIIPEKEKGIISKFGQINLLNNDKINFIRLMTVERLLKLIPNSEQREASSQALVQFLASHDISRLPLTFKRDYDRALAHIAKHYKFRAIPFSLQNTQNEMTTYSNEILSMLANIEDEPQVEIDWKRARIMINNQLADIQSTDSNTNLSTIKSYFQKCGIQCLKTQAFIGKLVSQIGLLSMIAQLNSEIFASILANNLFLGSAPFSPSLFIINVIDTNNFSIELVECRCINNMTIEHADSHDQHHDDLMFSMKITFALNPADSQSIAGVHGNMLLGYENTHCPRLDDYLQAYETKMKNMAGPCQNNTQLMKLHVHEKFFEKYTLCH